MSPEETQLLWKRCVAASDAAPLDGKSEQEARLAGRAVWDHWASKMSAWKKKLEEDHKLKLVPKDPGDLTDGDNAETKEWIKEATVDFSNFEFTNDVYCNGWHFPGPALFRYAKFCANAYFNDAVFELDADFEDANFKKLASFQGAQFKSSAYFEGATFASYARFRDVTFVDDAWFDNASFESYANFRDTKMFGRSKFHGARFEGSMSIGDAIFTQVPNFVQAHFEEAPRFDQTRIPPAGSVREGKGRASLSARYRALKRLAIQGNDYENELEFFSDELIARRGVQDFMLPKFDETRHLTWPNPARYWFGRGYELLSDFGRSLTRPLLTWVCVTFLFGVYYCFQHSTLSLSKVSVAGGTTTVHRGPQCRDDNYDAFYAALQYALNRALIVGGDSSDADKRALKCLYGSDADGSIIPTAVFFAGKAQTLTSAVLIFLFLLAIRNQFRIN